MAAKEYEVAYADKNEKYIILICVGCTEILIGPVETFTSQQYDEAIDEHNAETCSS